MGTMFKSKYPKAISTTLQKVFREESASGEFAKITAALKAKNQKNSKPLIQPTPAEISAANATFDQINKNFSDEITKCQNGSDTNMYRMAEPKFLLVVRIKGINKVAPKQKMILRLMKLRQINNAVFVKMSKATMNMLKFVESYVTFGTPSPKTVRALLQKRGCAKVRGGDRYVLRQRFSDEVVKTHMPEGMNSVTDVANAILTVGSNFKEVNSSLWPLKLQSPRGGLKCKRHAYLEQRPGDWGNRGPAINELVRRMM